MVYLHGAGWVAGDLDTHENVCCYLSNRVPCVVVAVNYRLAPEHKFPAALEDAYAATVWAAGHADQLNADAERLVIAGDSAGANLAAAVCLMAKERQSPLIVFQLLVNPALDMTAYEGEGFEQLRWFRMHYFNEENSINPYASPLLATDLSDLPPVLIIASEYDVLRGEAERFAERLGGQGYLSSTIA